MLPSLYLKIELSAGEQMLSLAYLNNYNVQDHPVAELNGDRNLFVDDIVFKGPLNNQDLRCQSLIQRFEINPLRETSGSMQEMFCRTL